MTRSDLKIGLALSAGGARGSALTGAMKVLDREGIRPSVITGSSIGSLVGGAHAAGIPLERIEQEWRETDAAKMLRSFFPTFPRVGLSSGHEVRKYLVALMGERKIEDLEIAYAAIGCDIDNGDTVTLTSGSLPDAIRASTAIPGVFHPVRWDGRILVDGGLVEPLPVKACRDLGAEFVIAIDISPRPQPTTSRVWETWNHLGEQVRALSHHPRIPDSLAGLLAQVGEDHDDRMRPMPGLYSILNQSLSILQQEVLRQKLLLHPPDVLIRPDVKMSTMGYMQAGEGIDVGEATAVAALPEIRKKLASL